MSNELLSAAGEDEDDSSEKRYEKLKKEQAGTDMDPAERRYDELKEEAKREFIRNTRKKDEDEEDEEEDKEQKIEDEKEDEFVTY